MSHIHVITSKETGLRNQAYGANELEAIQNIQAQDDRFPLGTFTILLEERREMKS